MTHKLYKNTTQIQTASGFNQIIMTSWWLHAKKMTSLPYFFYLTPTPTLPLSNFNFKHSSSIRPSNTHYLKEIRYCTIFFYKTIDKKWLNIWYKYMRITSIDNLIRVNRHFPDAPFPTLDPKTSGKSLTTLWNNNRGRWGKVYTYTFASVKIVLHFQQKELYLQYVRFSVSI